MGRLALYIAFGGGQFEAERVKPFSATSRYKTVTSANHNVVSFVCQEAKLKCSTSILQVSVCNLREAA